MNEQQGINQTLRVNNQQTSMNVWQEWTSVLCILFLGGSAIVVIGGQGLVIHYIQRHTPKDRPINKMFLIDQVIDCNYHHNIEIQMHSCHTLAL